jgi:ubiquitin-like protein ATG12
MLKFKAMGSAPVLNKDSYKIKTSQRFENVVVFLRNQLDIGPEVSLYLYINFSFMPALDENVGNLWAVSGKVVEGEEGGADAS